MPLTDIKICFVMCGSNFQHASTKFKIHMLVPMIGISFILARGSSNGQGTHDVLADQMRVARILRISTATAVSPGIVSGRVVAMVSQVSALRRYLHFEVIHETFLRLHLHFFIR